MQLVKFVRAMFGLLFLTVGICLPSSVYGQSAERVILFIIDGLATQAPERIDMPFFQALRETGVYFKAMHLPLPGHPEKSTDYPWSCSLPNPMLMSGTPFVGVQGIREKLIQHSFEPAQTAFIVNARSYLDVSGGFGVYLSKPRKPDSLVVDLAIEKMKEQDFSMMRVHLQRAGIEGMRGSKEKYADQPYYRNIWHEESLYRNAIKVADAELGRFVQWLKDKKMWEQTVLMICGDHGQADEGWHEPYSSAANKTPLLIVGGRIKKSRSFEYCEIFDVAPTMAYLAGKQSPELSQGRILHEAFDTQGKSPEVPQSVRRLNEVLIQANGMSESIKKTLAAEGFLSLDDLGRWHTTPAGTNFEKFVLQQEAILREIQK